MPKIFYTERDIDEMRAKGAASIDLTDNIVMTDLALERAMKYDMQINRVETTASPKATFSPSVNLAVSSVHEVARASLTDLKQKVKSMVLAKLDGEVDVAILDAVIMRVLDSL